MPLLHLIAGSNSSGRSSYAEDVLIPATGLPFVNADTIAAARWPGAEIDHAYDAAQAAEVDRRSRMAAGRSFISETVFSHPSEVRLVADAAAAGYLVHLHLIIVPVDLSVQRVRERVRRGGHDVPERKIRDRHRRLWPHVSAAIRLADVAEVLDNSAARRPFRLCASFRHGVLEGEPQWPSWAPAPLRELGCARQAASAARTV